MAALYQRARPVTFEEVVGQDHVKDVLTAAITRAKVGHAYLFSGPRGVGKTTTARLLAMAVNCDAAPDARPCGVCESCRLVQAGSHPDVIELDAASNNSVDDVRDLRERAMLASMRGGTRVWILDEAHMLSKAAANALLKTLEEPPSGLMFVLATTEPERLPPTVLSRCQHFRFRRLSDDEIRGKLARLVNGAGVAAETAALDLVARSADGGMRDAESLLERLLAGGESITLARTEDALGLPPHERLRAMAAALASHDLGGLLDEAASLYRAGYAPRTLAEQLARTLREAIHARLSGEAWLELDEDELLRLLHALDDEQERFVRHDDLYSLEVALIKARNALVGNVPAAFTLDPSAAGQVMATSSEEQPHSARAVGSATAGRSPERRTVGASQPEQSSSERPAGTSTAGRSAESHPTVASQKADPPPKVEEPHASHAEQRSSRESVAPAPFSWHAVRSQADMRLKAFLAPVQVEQTQGELHVTFPDANEFHHRQLLMRLDAFKELLTTVAGPGLTVTVNGPAGSSRFATAAASGGGPKKV